MRDRDDTRPAVYVATGDELIEAIREATLPIVEEAVTRAVQRATSKTYSTRGEAAEMLAVSVRQIDHLRKTRRLPYIKRGSRVLLETAALIAYAEEGRVSARGDQR